MRFHINKKSYRSVPMSDDKIWLHTEERLFLGGICVVSSHLQLWGPTYEQPEQNIGYVYNVRSGNGWEFRTR